RGEQLQPGGRAGRPRLELFNGQPRQHRLRRERAVVRDVSVLLLDQEPLFLALLELHQGPLAVELVAPQLEQQFALLQAFVRVFEWQPAPAVPHDDRARSVIPFRDDPLKVAVLEGVVLDVYGETLVGPVRRRSLGNGARLHHAVHFEPEIPVPPARRVHVDHEQASGGGGRNGGGGGRTGLRRAVQRPLGAVGPERIGTGLPFYGHRGAILYSAPHERTRRP